MTRVREVLATALVVGVALTLLDALLAPRTDRRNYELFAEMARSPARESFSASAQLPGGITNQPLVPGVVTRSATPFAFGAAPEEAERAGRELESPLPAPVPDADLERGRVVFGAFCGACHGADGAGQGPVVRRGMPAPSNLLADRARLLPDGALFHVLTRGQGNMTSFEAELTPLDRWRAIAWIRRMQGASQ